MKRTSEWRRGSEAEQGAPALENTRTTRSDAFGSVWRSRERVACHMLRNLFFRPQCGPCCSPVHTFCCLPSLLSEPILLLTMPSPEEASTSAKQLPDFEDLGLIDPLLEALKQLNFKKPTEIQAASLPPALEGRDIIGVASTGSGKTAAFALPILQKLWEEPKGLFAVVLAPTRELAFQISQHFEGLGAAMGVRCATIVGGMDDRMTQAVTLAKKPHIIVATPGRLNDHLENTKGFNLRNLKFLVSLFICIFYRESSSACLTRSWMKQIVSLTSTSVPSSTRYSKSYRRSARHTSSLRQ